MCEKCLYKKNCQFLATHKKAIVQGCDAFESVSKLRAEAITEFFERVCKEVEKTPNANEFFINAWKAKFAEIAKELKEKTNGETDL